MSSYDNRFGGTVINPSIISYDALTLTTAETELSWPIVYQDTPNVVASYISVTSNDDAYAIKMPPATQTSVGQTTIMANVGANNFNIVDNDGGSIIAGIAPTETYFLILTDNSTDAGVWETLQFGATTSSANAVALAGYGLTALANAKLNTYMPITEVAAPYTVELTDRSKVFVWTGGTGAITLPAAGDALDGFYIGIHNQSTVGGVVNVTAQAGETIDGDAVFNLNVLESSFFISDGNDWFTLGYGNSAVATVSVLDLDVSGGGTITLTAEQAQRQIQRFFGALPGNTTIEVPAITNFYYVENATTGAFDLDYKLVGGVTTTTIPQSQRMIFYSDSTDMYPAPSVFTGSVLFGNGTPADPSVTFANDTATGLYLNTAGNLGVTAAGSQILNIDAEGIENIAGTAIAPSYSFLADTNMGIYRAEADTIGFSTSGAVVAQIDTNSFQVKDGTELLPSLTFISEPATGIYRVGGNIIGCTINGNLTARLSADGLQLIDGDATAPSYSFSSDINTGFYSGGANLIGVSSDGNEVARFDTGGIKVIAGSAAIPSVSFPLDGDSGIYSVSADVVGISAGGTLRASVSANGIDIPEGETYSIQEINITSFMGLFP